MGRDSSSLLRGLALHPRKNGEHLTRDKQLKPKVLVLRDEDLWVDICLL